MDAIIGIDGLSKIKNNISIPSVAIGGINKTNFKDVLNTGIEGISVISAILGEDDISIAANNLLINK
ncbi:thiamine-phosphate pyrophosphorylase [Clostridium sporogenes]|nr:thiamine-phosphate pyrophosphorylase [Clostridium sporogenes]